MSRLELSLLGSPRIELDGSVVEVDTRKATALLAYLAVTGEAHRRDALAALLWPESDQTRAPLCGAPFPHLKGPWTEKD